MSHHPTFLHIVEEKSLKNTSYSCVPAVRDFMPGQLNIAFFETEKEFETAILETFTRMHRLPANVTPSPRHLLVISAHGKEASGTSLRLEKEKRAFNLRNHQGLFEIRPPELIVFVSACWGAYPSILQPLTAGDLTSKPVVIGPTVNIDPKYANILQHQIVQILREEQDIEASLGEAITTANNTLRALYGEEVWRIIKRDGTSIPDEGEVGFAAPMRESMAYRIVALQRQASNRAPEPDVAILLSSQDGVYWRGPLAVIKETTGDNAYNLIGQSLRLRGKPLRYVAPYKFGDLIRKRR